MQSYWHDHRREEGAWRLSEDSERIGAVTHTVTLGNGVVLHGEPGAGQDEFAWRVAQRLASRSGLLELSCPSDAATTASLAALADAPSSDGHVLFVPDIASFTGPDVDIVARLVLRNRAVVVAVSSDPNGAPTAPLAQLLKLERVRVRQLSTEAATAYLENGLGGPISERAAYAVWDSASGNRAMMRMIADDWLESDYLVREDDVWVVRGSAPPAGRRLVGYWQLWLGEQDPDLRDVFEFLALAGELPLNILLKLCGGDAVDAVHNLGYLGLRDSAGREVSLRGMVSSPAIAAQVPPGRSRSLLDRVTEFVDDRGLHRPPGLVSWRLRCGLPVKPARYIEGAEHLLTAVSPADALAMLNSVPPDVDPERVNAVRVGALLTAGHFVDQRAKAGNLRLGSVPHLADGGSLRPAQKALHEHNGGRENAAAVSAAELIEAAWRGDFRPILEAETSRPRLVDGVGWLWEQIVHEALVLTGRVREGLQHERELLHALEQSGTTLFLIQRGRLGLFDMETLAGEWSRASATLGGGWDPVSGAPGQGKMGSLYDAISFVLKGEYASSADILRREIPQLRTLGRYDLLPMAHSLRAVSLACTGQRAEALSALAAVDVAGGEGESIWRLTWAAAYFSAQAMGYVGRIDGAIERLMAFAERDHDLGNHSQELLTLSAAVQWGHEPALDLLGDAAGRVDGRFAEACMWVVRGVRTGHLEELEYGGLLARTIGQHFFADYAQQQLELLNGPCPKATEQEERARDEKDRGAETTRQGFLLLTPRQRTIAYHVLADKSNGDIASTIGVSVRTVESHLYQAYAKLNVGNRAELRATMANWYPTAQRPH